MMRLRNVALTGQWFFFLSLRFPSAFFFLFCSALPIVACFILSLPLWSSQTFPVLFFLSFCYCFHSCTLLLLRFWFSEMTKTMATLVLVSTISSAYILSFCSFLSPSRAASPLSLLSCSLPPVFFFLPIFPPCVSLFSPFLFCPLFLPLSVSSSSVLLSSRVSPLPLFFFFSFLCLVVFSPLGFFCSSCSPPSSSFIFLFLPQFSLFSFHFPSASCLSCPPLFSTSSGFYSQRM